MIISAITYELVSDSLRVLSPSAFVIRAHLLLGTCPVTFTNVSINHIGTDTSEWTYDHVTSREIVDINIQSQEKLDLFIYFLKYQSIQ